MNSELIVIIVSVLGICVFLPALVVWMVSRRKMYEAEKRTEIALSYMKENPHCNLEDLVRKIEPKVDKNAMLLPLLWVGIMFGIIAGLLIGILATQELASKQGTVFLIFITGVCLALCIPSLICYFVGKKK
ncbi:MAG: hypothetical protein PUC53_07880 [Bacteroidales bacterium]|nr:hypothetical protein [Bacteroidales bacterium]